MTILQRISLENYSTMGLGGIAAFLTEVRTRMDVIQALSWAQTHSLPAIMIGGGSNIIWQDSGFNGLVIINKIERFEVFDEDAENTYLTVGAGESWDSVVARSVANNLSGIECLSLIPGTAGATPIQNVGAYGQQVSDSIVTIEAFDTAAKDFVTIPTSDCAFGYRTSRFKTTDRGRFYITAITYHLRHSPLLPPYYPALESYLNEHSQNIQPSPAQIRAAVIAIRSAKLPDPNTIRNVGSFFANPSISVGQYTQLQADYMGSGIIPHWTNDDGSIKLSAAWLIEQAGLSDYHDSATGMATWALQPLVLVNESAAKTGDLIKFRDFIVDKVNQSFHIVLEQEPELVPVID